jgi:hypothetical protein
VLTGESVWRLFGVVSGLVRGTYMLCFDVSACVGCQPQKPCLEKLGGLMFWSVGLRFFAFRELRLMHGRQVPAQFGTLSLHGPSRGIVAGRGLEAWK